MRAPIVPQAVATLYASSMTKPLRKAVILARGLGSRMRRHDARAVLDAGQAETADSGMKAMIPVGGGRPFLDYVLSGLADAGYRDVCLVVGPEHGGVREYYNRQKLERISLDYTVQAEPRGTADAVLAAEAFADDEEFLVINSDNYYPVAVLQELREFGEPGTVLFDPAELVRHGNIPAERIRSYAYAEVRDGQLVDLIEKPNAAESAKIRANAPVSMNIWRFSNEIFEHCRRVPLSSRGEYELPQAVNHALREGMRLRVTCSKLGVLDLSRRTDVASVTSALSTVEVRL